MTMQRLAVTGPHANQVTLTLVRHDAGPDELLGADADSEGAIRWLIAVMVLCCDR
jgi:hypothetical protein